MTIVSQRSNVTVPASPPVHFYPNSNGDAIPVGGVGWELSVDSANYSPGDTADLAVEYQYAGVWQEDASVGGFTLGTYTGKNGTTSINTLSSSIGVNASPYPDRGRVRIDRMPAGVLTTVTLTLN